MNSEVFVLSAVRTPIGRFGGALQNVSPVDLAAHAMTGALNKAGVAAERLDLIAYGNVLRAGHGQLVPRQAAFKAGIPDTVDAVAIDMVCSSGMMSTMIGATNIKAGEADLVLTGGVESMSGAGFYLPSGARWGFKYGGRQLVDILEYDGLTDPFSGDAMGLQTEKLAAEREILRADLDVISAESHARAARAQSAGAFRDEILSIDYRDRRETKTLDYDEGVRSSTTVDALSQLRTAFTKDGVLTAGNSSQISDGAAGLLLASAAWVRDNGAKPLARITASAWAAGEPYKFPEAPVPAVKRVLDKTETKIADYDLFENNEAFAINSILFHRMLGVPYEKLNVHGGAIALGHPIGCSGARIVVTLIHALRRQGGRRGMASICHGTGGGTALAVELIG
jgi:acetyl-CoA C-acetyltransferase